MECVLFLTLSKFFTWLHTRPNETINDGHSPYTYIIPCKRWPATNYLQNLLYVKIWPVFTLHLFLSQFGIDRNYRGIIFSVLFSLHFHFPFFLSRFSYQIFRCWYFKYATTRMYGQLFSFRVFTFLILWLCICPCLSSFPVFHLALSCFPYHILSSFNTAVTFFWF